MKYNVRLVYAHDDRIGDFGWRVKKFPFMNIANARGLTHDILEHAPNDTGTWHEEISAFGAMVAYRVNRSILLYPDEGTEKDKVKKLAEELAYLISDGWAIKNEFVFKLTNKNPRYPIHPYIQLLAEETAKLIEVPDSYTESIDVKYLTIWLINWLKQGHKRATRVIKQSGWYAEYIWEAVCETIHFELFKNRNEFYENDEVSVQIDFDRCHCQIKPINCKIRSRQFYD